MIDKDKMFSLFEQPEGKKDGKELVTFSNSLLEEPFTKIGMFTKLIINHNVFHQKLEKFLKAEKPDYDVQEARRASEFTVFNRAWHYISKIDLEDRNHLEAIMDFKSKPFLLSLDQSIEYFQGPDIEEYEKCAKLLEIKKLKEEIENPVTI
jgi:predicted nucleic acid-binding protein